MATEQLLDADAYLAEVCESNTELIGGRVVMEDAVLRHQLIVMNICTALREWVASPSGSGLATINVDVRISDHDVPKPDVLWYADPARAHLDAVQVNAPDLVVEVFARRARGNTTSARSSRSTSDATCAKRGWSTTRRGPCSSTAAATRAPRASTSTSKQLTTPRSPRRCSRASAFRSPRRCGLPEPYRGGSTALARRLHLRCEPLTLRTASCPARAGRRCPTCWSPCATS